MTRPTGCSFSPEPTVTAREMMAIAAGRLVCNDDVVFAGTGVALLAAMAAKRIYAPRATIFFETGSIGPSLDEIPMAVSDSRVMAGSCLNAGLVESFSYVASPRLHTIAFLGAAQVDPHGNLNSTCIGDVRHPTVRFAGSGGACDAASLASSYIVFMAHGRRKFVERLDYLTSPGWLEGGESRARAGFARGGPLAVVTDLCLLRFDEDTKRMYLAERYPGVTDALVLEHTGFDLDVSRAVDAEPPSPEDLRILRDDVDPQRLILG
jgi:glutaconate CoA-transferase, subunit B